MFENCKWIWLHNDEIPDEYVDFIAEFDLEECSNLKLDISFDGNFEAYLNGELCAFGSCADYSFYKLFDSFPLDDYCRYGKNELKITVWHIGCKSSVYSMANAGLIFKVTQNSRDVVCSNERVLARQNVNYANGMCKYITSQLGPSYYYDNTVVNNAEYRGSVIVEKTYSITARGIDNLKLLPRIPVTVDDNGKRLLIDFGREDVGYLDLEFDSDGEQELKIIYGEHLLEDGSVPQNISERDFSIGFKAKAGENRFLGMMRRIAGRYIEIEYNAPIKVEYIGIRAVVYPLNIKEVAFDNALHKRIYDCCVRTLQCCMHEHYEDCPWREQALYSLDSRNQMLCGYVAFEEYKYPRYNIILLSKALHKGLLRITSPTDKELPIPFFSLTFIQQLYEYVNHSGDVGILEEVLPVAQAIIDNFVSHIDASGLIPALPDPAWNFYEWSDGNTGYGNPVNDVPRYDLCLNAMFLYVSPMFKEMGGSIDVNLDDMRSTLRLKLFDKAKGLFKNSSKDPRFSIVGNSLAILAGAGDATVADKLVTERKALTDVTLSMNAYFYDALLSVDKGYKDYIIKDVEEKYGYMLSEGATTFWETIDGWHAFGDAGSLCHGWSALPIYYLDLLGCIK